MFFVKRKIFLVMAAVEDVVRQLHRDSLFVLFASLLHELMFIWLLEHILVKFVWKIENFSWKNTIHKALKWKLTLLFGEGLLYCMMQYWLYINFFCSDNVSLIYQCELSFQWKSKSSQPFEVTLLLLSFFIAWIEAWFVDFRVLPQEGRARRVVEGESSVDAINKANHKKFELHIIIALLTLCDMTSG